MRDTRKFVILGWETPIAPCLLSQISWPAPEVSQACNDRQANRTTFIYICSTALDSLRRVPWQALMPILTSADLAFYEFVRLSS